MARGQKMDRRGIVGGRGRLLRDYYKEQREEDARWRKQRRKGEKAREIESERGSLWSMLGTGVALFGTRGNIPLSLAIGAGVGNIAKGVGTWDDGKRIEDIGFMDKNVGKFEKGQIEDVKDYNRALSAYDKKEFWKGIADVAKSAAYAYVSSKIPTKEPTGALPEDTGTSFFSRTQTEEPFLGLKPSETQWEMPSFSDMPDEALDVGVWNPETRNFGNIQGDWVGRSGGFTSSFPSDVEVDYLQPSYSFPEPEAFGPPGSGGIWERFFNRPGGGY